MSVNVSSAPLPSEEALRQQYAVHVDMLKFYLELLVKVNAFYYALTGAVLSYVLAHNLFSFLRNALWLPVLLGAGILGVEIFGIRRSKIFAQEMERSARGLNLIAWPEGRVLTASIWASAAVRFVLLVGMLWFIWCGPGGDMPKWFRAWSRTPTPAYDTQTEAPAVVEETGTEVSTPVFRAEDFIPVTTPTAPTNKPKK